MATLGNTTITNLNSGTIRIQPILGSYQEGIRIQPYSAWSTIMLLGTDSTASASGTSAKSWGIFNNDGNFYINKNGSSNQQSPRLWGHSNGFTIGNTNLSSYALNTASFICNSWIRTKGATGWYNEDYGGGWYMTDATAIRNYNSKAVALDNNLSVGGTLSVTGTSAFTGASTFTGTSTFTGKTTHNGGIGTTSLSASSTLAVTGTSTFTGKTTHNGGIGTTSLSASSQITSTVANGTAPFVVASSTKVANLNADYLDGISSDGYLQYVTQNATFSSVANIGTNLTPGIHRVHISGVEYSSILTGKDFNGSYWQLYFHPTSGYTQDIKYRASNCDWKTLIDSNNYTSYAATSTHKHTFTGSSVTTSSNNGHTPAGTVSLSGSLSSGTLTITASFAGSAVAAHTHTVTAAGAISTPTT